MVTDTSLTLIEKARGCLLAGAVGDALGAPVEFMSIDEIVRQFGSSGITGYAPAYGGTGKITDDTQMTLFTAEGLIRASVRGQRKGICHFPSVVAHAYQRWLLTQGHSNPEISAATDGWLFGINELHSQRAPGITCLTALESMSYFGEAAINDSKGCGGVMRVAPVAFIGAATGDNTNATSAFETAVEICALTHGHPTGQLAGGYFAALLTLLSNGEQLLPAAIKCIDILRNHENHSEVLTHIERAIEKSTASPNCRNTLTELGEGWVAEEALAMSLYCALSSDNLQDALILAVNHSGDSDSTGAITGNIVGLMAGERAIPAEWLETLELKNVITEVAEDLLTADNGTDSWWARYPGH